MQGAPMHHRLVYFVAIALALSGCGIQGHTHDPAEAHQPLPVTFYAGKVLSVQAAAIGAPEGGAAVTLGLRPTELIGAHVRPGWQPAGGKASITAAGLDIGPEVGEPASALEYTVAVDNGSKQIVQTSQFVLPEDLALTPPDGVILPGNHVVIRVVGSSGRVLPLALVPPEFRDRVQHAELDLPLGASPPVYASPARLWAGAEPVAPRYVAAAYR
jgi:hypothetical protein